MAKKAPAYMLTPSELRAEEQARVALKTYQLRERQPEMGAAMHEARALFERVSITFHDELFDREDRFRVLAAALYDAGRAAVAAAERDREQATKAQVSGIVDELKRSLDRFEQSLTSRSI